jgi:hypothetical protein
MRSSPALSRKNSLDLTLLIACQVLHATVAKQKALVEALESVQESSRVKVPILLQFITTLYDCSEVNYILL